MLGVQPASVHLWGSQRPVMRQFIQGEHRLYPPLSLQVNECKKESLSASPMSLGDPVRVRSCSWQIGQGASGRVLCLPLSGLSGDREGLASSCVCKLSISMFFLSRSCWRPLISACECHTARNLSREDTLLCALCVPTHLFKHAQLKASLKNSLHLCAF